LIIEEGDWKPTMTASKKSNNDPARKDSAVPARGKTTSGIGSRIAGRFAAVGGIDLPEPDRSAPRPAPTFEEGIDS